MSLDQYRTLGRSGLAVSPFCLGTMTFGTSRWGSGESVSRDVFNAYVDRGGNFVDTANVYASGRSEEWLGAFMRERGLRDSVVLATKAGFATGSGAHAGGNGAKHMHAALENSLRRLNTDYVDLFWVHVWDSVTPAEELLETMTGLVRSGKIRYWGLSNSPAWYVARLATLAALRGVPGPIALQYFYSLAQRDIEHEFVTMATQLGLGIVPWSPLAFGLLTGKYDRATVERDGPRAAGLPREAAPDGAQRDADDKRLDGANPFGDTLFTDKNWRILDVLTALAAECGHSPARLALAWIAGRPGVASTLLGVSSVEQLDQNLGPSALELTAQQRATLDAVSAPVPSMLHSLFTPALRQHAVFGGAAVAPWHS